MYFFKHKGRQILDLRGDFVLSHNDAVAIGRVKSAAPKSVRNARYFINVKSHKLHATWLALKFIWGKNRALRTDDII